MRLYVLIERGPDGAVSSEAVATPQMIEGDPEGWSDRIVASAREVREGWRGNPIAPSGFGVLTLDVDDAMVEAALERGLNSAIETREGY